MLSPVAPNSISSLRQLALKMEKILLVALENYGNTFVEPKVELGARFGHLVREYFVDVSGVVLGSVKRFRLCFATSAISGHLPSYPSLEHCSDKSEATGRDEKVLAKGRL